MDVDMDKTPIEATVEDVSLDVCVDDVTFDVTIGDNCVELSSDGGWIRSGREEINGFVETQMKPELTAYTQMLETVVQAEITAHVTHKTVEFDAHAAEKQATVDASAEQAAASAVQAAAIVENTATRDLDNLTEAGQAKFGAKQDVLTFDDTPTEGSLNPVTSGGVYAPIAILQTADTQNVKLSGDQTIGGVKTFSSSPKVPTAAKSSNDTTAASTAFVKSFAPYITEVYSSGNNWYILFSNKLCIQGSHTATNSTAKDLTFTVNLIKKLKNTTYTLLALGNRTDNGASYINNTSFTIQRTTSNFKFRSYGDGAAHYVDWIAIGYVS